MRVFFSLLLALIATGATAGTANQHQTFTIVNREASFDIVRCHLDEGRIVVRTGGELMVQRY